ncbi:MAG TPA: MFS transporter [Usitatibacter sp.]|nr:MFS transporter [Usitatibacter sp.]
MLRLTPLVSALGVAQVISWGTLFYAIGVLGPAMRAELGMTDLFLFGAFTAGLLVSGTFAPLAGRMVDQRGGRAVLSIGSLLGFVACAMIALAPNAAVMVAGWLVAGAAMAACLYDPAFATLSQLAGDRYRRALTALTLFGGFASTVFWPLSHLLLEAWGWRETFAIYAAMHLLVCLPIHVYLVPRPAMRAVHAQVAAEPVPRSPGLDDPRLRWLTAAMAIATFVFGVIAVHMIALLTTGGLTDAQAVTIAMLAGPMQVAGRIVEFGIAPRVRAAHIGYASFVLMLGSLVALIAVNGMGGLAIVFVVAYGCGNGVLTIVKGTAPAELFGRVGLGGLLGHMSRAGSYAKAVAPASYSAMLALGLTRNASLMALAGLTFAALAAYAVAMRPRTAAAAITR